MPITRPYLRQRAGVVCLQCHMRKVTLLFHHDAAHRNTVDRELDQMRLAAATVLPMHKLLEDGPAMSEAPWPAKGRQDASSSLGDATSPGFRTALASKP